MLFDAIIYKCRMSAFYKKWKKQNQHNFCEVQTIFDMNRVHIGNRTYGMINPHLFDNIQSQLYIGSFCSIAENVHFVLGEHDYSKFSTYPYNAFINKHEKEIPKTKGDIVVEDDVWIGINSIILSGVTIHQGAVIGAGSVVSSDIPPYAVYAGGKIIKYRFSNEIINKLLTIDYKKITDQFIINNYNLLNGNINDFINSKIFIDICTDIK